MVLLAELLEVSGLQLDLDLAPEEGRVLGVVAVVNLGQVLQQHLRVVDALGTDLREHLGRVDGGGGCNRDVFHVGATATGGVIVVATVRLAGLFLLGNFLFEFLWTHVGLAGGAHGRKQFRFQ